MKKIIKIIILIFVLGLVVYLTFLPFEIWRKKPEKVSPIRIY